MFKKVPILATVLTCFSSHSAFSMVFESDQRLDFFEIQDPAIQAIAKSVFTFIPRENLFKRADGRFEFLSHKTLQEVVGLCPGERFENQPSVGTRCSGFLSSPTQGVTAGHCVSPLEVKDFCKNYFVVFDYRIPSGESGAPLILDSSSVNECKEITSVVYDPAGRTDDYAVFTFSTPVTDRQPLKYRTTGQIGDQDGIFMLGYPKGLPEKISPNRNVLMNADPSYFSTNLDCFHGNSGSPVFNSRTLEVEGIFVRGEGDFPGSSSDPNLTGDFFYNSSQQCFQTQVCRRSEGCTGVMDATRITRISW